MRLFKSRADALEQEVQFLRAQVAQLQNYVLMVMPPQTNTFPNWNIETGEEQTEGVTPRRMYTTEDEEDIEFALTEGLIDKAHAAELLRKAGALNDDIEI
jgi:hypothetical protein